MSVSETVNQLSSGSSHVRQLVPGTVIVSVRVLLRTLHTTNSGSALERSDDCELASHELNVVFALGARDTRGTVGWGGIAEVWDEGVVGEGTLVGEDVLWRDVLGGVVLGTDDSVAVGDKDRALE